MKKILLILAAGCTMALVSCEEWLDKYPLAQMSPETFFSNENELQAFSNKFYTVFPSDGLYNEYWDNIIHNDLPQETSAMVQPAASIINNIFFMVLLV